LIFQLTDKLIFPDPSLAEPDGLLAVGGDLRVERLLLAYENGIFPWFSPGEPILWYATNPRFVLFPKNIRVSKSMKQWMRNTEFVVTENQQFSEVIQACANADRNGQLGTWIGNEMIQAYTKLHELGFAKSIEIIIDGKLSGGLYGVKLNNSFFGESMFTLKANASKAALIHLCQQHDYSVIDCQMYTKHLESMGAEMISFESFLGIIQA